MIYCLAIVVFALLIFTYFGVSRDLMHPSVLTVGASFISILAALYNVNRWGIKYHYNTMIILVSALVCISVTGIISARSKMGKRKHSMTDEDEATCENHPFFVNNIVFWIVIAFNLLVLVWYYYIILKTTGGGAITEMIASFRMIHSYGVSTADSVSMPAVLNQCIKFNKVLAYIFMMIFLNNAVGYKVKTWKYLLPPVLFCIQTLLGSDRIYIVMLAGASVIMAYLLWHRKNGWNSNISGKYVKIGAKALVILLIFFFAVRNFVGHSSSSDSKGPMEYLTQYVGGSIQLLDMYVQDPLVEADAGWGEETFSSIYKTIVEIQGGTAEKRHMEFRSSNGIIIGNIYTAVRKYYHDFGYWGVVILCSIFGLFFGLIYKRLQQQRVKN